MYFHKLASFLNHENSQIQESSVILKDFQNQKCSVIHLYFQILINFQRRICVRTQINLLKHKNYQIQESSAIQINLQAESFSNSERF